MVTTRELTRLSDAIGTNSTLSRGTTCVGLQVRTGVSLISTSMAEPLNAKLSPVSIVEGKPDLTGEAVISRIPVLSFNGQPLMPCKPTKARKLIEKGLATKQWSKLRIFYLRLKFDPKSPATQPLSLGIDPGSKFEGYSVVGTEDTVVNIMPEATDWVSKSLEQRWIMRRARRYRKMRRRKSKRNRLVNGKRLPSSTRARWDTKLRIVNQLKQILPIGTIVVEDIKAETRKGSRRWNKSFSSLEIGKQYFYNAVEKEFSLVVKQGYEKKLLRDHYRLDKCQDKAKPIFETHCVDAWVLAASTTGAESPTTRSINYLVPLRLHRRQLHRLQGNRKRYGGTNSLGLKRGTLVNHPAYGFCYTGGNLDGRISIHSLNDGKRLTQTARIEDCKPLTKVSFRSQFLPSLKSGVSLVI